MKILVTGAAGFIGTSTIRALMERGYEIIGIDNLNGYYDPELKLARLESTGIDRAEVMREGEAVSGTYPGYRFKRLDLADREGIDRLFDREGIEGVINLGGQAGVRYSLVNPYAYIESNVVGFLNILENCRRHPVQHLVYASSSSVYGMRNEMPYRESDKTDTPVSLYAATKKSDELMAYAYSHLYGIPATGLRFFTVYGPWGRPDMAPYLFMNAVLEGKPIRVFNHGDMQRDFTYIDDIVEGVVRVLEHAHEGAEGEVCHRIYNIGHSKPIELMDFIRTIERVTGRTAILQMEGMQAGDVTCTYADTTRLEEDFDFHPRIGVEEGIRRYYEWYKRYYRVESGEWRAESGEWRAESKPGDRF
ncbi:MAG: NAD-dependent epimerase/dehydratase family protein [Lepagella sp.]